MDTREALVQAATRLFLSRGLTSVPMEDVATEAGCTRRTLYRYYSAKEDLAVDVATALLTAWNDHQQRLFDATAGTGAVRLEAFLGSLVEALEGRRPELCFLGEFDFVVRDALPYKPDPDRQARFLAASLGTEALVGRLVDQGRADGSLASALPNAVLVPTLTTALWSLAQRVALRDEHLRREYGVPGLALLRAQVGLLVQGLRPPGGPHEEL